MNIKLIAGGTGFLCALLVNFSLAGWAKPLHFHVAGGQGNNVEFTSNAPVEVMHGKTNHIQGEITLDDSFKFDAKHPFHIFFSVDLASIDTGINLRNEHMRDNFLETGKYPQATYKATSIKMEGKPDLRKPQTVHLISSGDFTLHGVTEKKTIPLTVDYEPAKAQKPAQVTAHGKFPIPLEQFHIKRPEAVLVKLADTVFVDLTTVGIQTLK
jgi:polyisoprenoid-binding protein YceI